MFKKSTGGSAIEWATLVWAKKDESIPTPNFEFYNADTGATSYMVSPGERATPQIDGIITKIDVDYRAGYNDRKNATGEKNEMRLRIFMSPDGGPAQSALTMPLVSDVGVPNYNSLSLLATINSFLKQGLRDCPIRLSFFQRKSAKDGKFYPASSMILGSRNEQNEFLVDENGEFVFDNYKENMIRTSEEDMRPNPKAILRDDGTPLLINGMRAYDHTDAINWVNNVMSYVLAHYETEGETQGHHDHEYEMDGVDPGAAFDEQYEQHQAQAQQRPRM